MDALAARTGRQYHLFDYIGDPAAERVIVIMGSGAQTAARDRPLPGRPGREGRRRHRAAVPAVPRRRPARRAARHGAPGGGAGPDQGAGIARRAAVQDVVGALAEAQRPGARRDAGGHRRALRPVVQGVHAGDGGGRLHDLSPGARSSTSRSASSTTSPHRAALRPDLDIEPDDVVRAVFFGLGADGTVGANKNSIKIIGEENGTTPRATSFTTRRSQDRHHGLAPPFRPGADPLGVSGPCGANFVACHHFQFWSGRRVGSRCARGVVAVEFAASGRGGLGQPPPRGAGADDGQAAPGVRDRREPGGPGRSLAGVSTPSCKRASSPFPACCPVRRRLRDQGGDRQDLRQPGARWCSGTSPRWTTARRAAPDPGAGRVPPTGPPLVPADAPDFVQTCADDGRAGDLLPVSALPVDGTFPRGPPVREAEHRRVVADVGPGRVHSVRASAASSARTP